MAGRSKGESVDRFCGFFKESLSCLTNHHLHPIRKSENLYLLTYEPPASLESDSLLSLSITQLFTVVPDRDRGGHKVKTRQYSYTLNDEETDGAPEVVSYHWHPDESDVRYPHLHVGCVPRVHFPTARISVERFIGMLIRYYGVRPILAHSEWSSILDRNDKAFYRMASWK